MNIELRDYFAAKAMPAVYSEYCSSAEKVGFDEGWMMGVAMDAYAMADAMLAAREVGKPNKKADDDWIEWHGGACPVDRDAVVELKILGDYCTHITGDPRAYRWSHKNDRGDIIAYRVVQP